MQFEIRNRFTGEVQFTAEIDCDEAADRSLKVGLAVRRALENYVDLSGTNLSYASLRGINLRGINLREANLSHADLQGADLSDAYLSDVDLSGANLRRAYLSDDDWIPVVENIHKRVYEAAAQEGALDMESWHKYGFCGTTHCRAGWVTHLAGEEGRVLDEAYGTSTAAALIYMASDPDLERIPDFYSSNEDALADMKRLAEASQRRTRAKSGETGE